MLNIWKRFFESSNNLVYALSDEINDLKIYFKF